MFLIVFAFLPLLLLFIRLFFPHIGVLSSSDNVEHRDGAVVLLVIAHPDDESMFFGPVMDAINKQHSCNTLRSFHGKPILHVLCLTSSFN